MIYTVETRLNPTPEEESFLLEDCRISSTWFRKSFQHYSKHRDEILLYHFLTAQKINSKQAKSLVNQSKGQYMAQRENQLYRQKELEAKIYSKTQFVETLKRKIKYQELQAAHPTTNRSQWLALKREIKAKTLVLQQKTQSLDLSLQKKKALDLQIQQEKMSVCFGTKKQLQARMALDPQDLHYDRDLTRWKENWDRSRNGERFALGDKRSPLGNPEIQYDPQKNIIRLRLTEELVQQRLKARDTQDKKVLPCRFLEIPCVGFPYLERLAKKGQTSIVELLKNKPITARIKRKEKGFYLYLSLDLVTETKKVHGLNTLGIDFNADGLAYSVIKPDGNRLPHSSDFIRLEKHDSAERNAWELSNALETLIRIAQTKNCGSITLENLEFFEAKSHLRTGHNNKGRKFNKMLSLLAYQAFQEWVIRKAERVGLKVNLINPRYSSIAGYVKYAHRTNQSADLGAAQAIGRQSLQPQKQQYQKKTDLNHVTRFKLQKELIPSLFRTQPVNQKSDATKLHRKIRKSETVSTWNGMLKVLGPRHAWRENLNAFWPKAYFNPGEIQIPLLHPSS